MARKLSILQQAYRDFFLGMLSEYGVNSPAQLSVEQKKEFFNKIKVGWKIKKNTILEKQKPKTKTKKEGYATIKKVLPPIAIEPKPSYKKRTQLNQEAGAAVIISSPNPKQTKDLCIGFSPNDFFEQAEPYKYPVVKMPEPDALLKLPRKGRALGKGFKEKDFYNALKREFLDLEVHDDFHMVIPHFNRPYEPDIVLVDNNLNLYIDIEIDEPYDGYFRFPTHEEDKDETRDLFFIESGWVVIRFTERQVHLQEYQCIAFIKDVVNSIRNYELEIKSNCKEEKQWDYQQAISWEKVKYREKYLNIDRFGKQLSKSEIFVDVEDQEEIETNLDRTKKFSSNNKQDNIAFEDESHKYHHPKDETGNAEYISVTTLIDRFFPFDLDKFIKGKAKKEGKSEEEVLEEFIKNRDEAAEKGTFLHEQIEYFLTGRAYDGKSKEFQMFLKFHQEVIEKNGFQFVEAEKRVLLDPYNVAGTVDALFKKPNKEEYLILDWKRSKKLVIDCHPRKFGYGYGLSELNHLDNSSYYKYALQQNLYKYILETNYGMPISSMNLIVLHENYDDYCRVSLGEYSREVAIILESINHKI
jgi:hypothetical protein